MYNNYIDDCLNGDALLTDIDDYIQYWHTHDIECELDEFLGLSEFEAEQWLQEGNIIFRDILYCRRNNLAYEDYLSMPKENKIAARSYNLKDVKRYKDDIK